jgi:hypothetical protein
MASNAHSPYKKIYAAQWSGPTGGIGLIQVGVSTVIGSVRNPRLQTPRQGATLE